jgi:hypothetical protein
METTSWFITNCSVGSGEDGVYAELGEGVMLFSKSAVIGRCKLGCNVVVKSLRKRTDLF